MKHAHAKSVQAVALVAAAAVQAVVLVEAVATKASITPKS
jgi:hypothetical protein